MNTLDVALSIFLLTIIVISGFVFKHHTLIVRMESYLTNNHGFDSSKELGFYKPFDYKE